MKPIALDAALAAVAVAAVWNCPQPAAACKCMQLTPAEAAEQATAVFEGRVVEVSDTGTPQAPQRSVKLRVVRAWKGMQTEEAVVTTASDSAACGIQFARDQNYVVYASAQDGALHATSCSRTRLLADADEDVKALGMGWTPVDPNKDQAQPEEKKAEPPARGGCASCALERGRTPAGAIASLVPVLWLARRRSRSR